MNMGLYKLLEKKRSDIVKSWFDAVIKTYHADSNAFMSNVSDPFSNPVGSNIKSSLEKVLDAMLSGAEPDKLKSLIDPIVRIRAVQSFKPSEAVSFVFALKGVVGEIAEKGACEGREIKAFYSRVDELLLIAFDVYMECRELIFSFRANHVKSRTLNLLEKANILCEVPDVGTEIIPHDVYKNGGFGEE